MHSSKEEARKAAKEQFGARAVEGMDFVILHGWTVRPVVTATDAAALAQAERFAHPTSSVVARAKKSAAALPQVAAEQRTITSPNRSAGAKSGHAKRRTKQPPKPAAPEGKTKTDLLAEMMTRPDGATSKEMEQATGWAPHSVRGLIGGLKKKGVRIDSLKVAGEGPTRYKVVEAPEVTPAPVQDVGDVL